MSKKHAHAIVESDGLTYGGVAKHAKELRLGPDWFADLFSPQKCRGGSIEVCGACIARFFAEHGWTLIYFSVFHENNKIDPYHIYVDVPDHILTMCEEYKSLGCAFRRIRPPEQVAGCVGMRTLGGCPIAKEAIRLAQPFDVLDLDYTNYDDDLSRRYRDAFRNLAFPKIIAVPVQIGGGVEIFVLGGDPSAEQTIPEELAATIAYQLMVNIAARFPEIEKHFERKKLTTREAQILSLTADGLVETEIAMALDISPNTVRTHIENIKRKMDARNKTHAVALAIEACEISDPTPRFANSAMS